MSFAAAPAAPGSHIIVPRHLAQTGGAVIGSGLPTSSLGAVEEFLANPPAFLQNIVDDTPEEVEKPWVAAANGRVIAGAEAVPRHLRQSGANVLGSCSSFETQRVQPKSPVYQQRHEAQSARVTPLYPGLSSPQRTQRTSQQRSQQFGSPQSSSQFASTRCRTPLPAPSTLGSNSLAASSPLSKSLTSPIRQSRAPRSFAYAHLAPASTAVYDPQLPSPTVIVHAATPSAQKNAQERKHRGVSRNVLGGYFTS